MLPSCPVGESLATCTASLDFSSWFVHDRDCPHTTRTVNPPANQRVRMIDTDTYNDACVTLGPASFIVTTATSVVTSGIQPLQGKSGIEINLPQDQWPTYDAAVGASFHRPLAILFDGQIVYGEVVEPTNATYQPVGGTVLVYATEAQDALISTALR